MTGAADLCAIAAHYGGKLAGRECLIPTPGHSSRDRGTAIRLAPGAPDDLLVTCYNGGPAEALVVKDMLRRDGFLPARDDRCRRELTEAEREAIRRAEAEREREKAEAHASAAEDARKRLSGARPADPAHPYLVRKRLPPERLWQVGKWLLVPMQDETGAIWNLQRIAPAPSEEGWPKLFLKGGRTAGLFWWAGKPTDRLVIGEGMATCAAVRRATGLPVVAAMSCQNLPTIAAAVRAKRPDLALTIAADDDPKGHEYARKAASLVRASIAFPGVTGT